jgi:hypothetical protein
VAAELHPDECPRLESNQHLLDFSQAPSPDRLRGHRCGRGGARPRASSSLRFSESAFVAQQGCSGTRIRTSTSRVKTCRPAISRSPIGAVPGPGFEPGFLRSERRGLPLADPGMFRGPAGTRTPLARSRAECFAIKASGPHLPRLPPAGLDPAHPGRGRTRTCARAYPPTGLQPACTVRLAARMHAPPTRSCHSFPVP